MALEAEVASLKNELRDLRTLASSVAAAPPNSETSAAPQPNNNELRSLKEDLDQLKEVVSKSYAEVTARGHLSADTKNHKRSGKGRHNQARSQRDENSSGKDYSRPTTSKERVVGARKIWGTLRTTTSNAVSSTLSKLPRVTRSKSSVSTNLFKIQIKLLVGGLHLEVAKICYKRLRMSGIMYQHKQTGSWNPC